VEATPRRSAGLVAFVLLWTSVTVVAAVLERAVVSQIFPRGSWGLMTGLAQTLVLGAGVRWRWWWAPATVGGALLPQILLPLIGHGLPIAVLQALARVGFALPQWLLLRRYGWRSLAWLAVAAASGPVLVRIFRAMSGAGTAAGQFPSLLSVATASAVVAFIEAMVLAWMLRAELLAPATTESPAPATGSVVDSRAQVASVFVLNIALLGLATVVVFPEWFVQSYDRARPATRSILLGALVPWMVACLLLPWRRGRHLGLALAASASILVLLPLVPFMAFWTLLSGHMLGNKDQWASYFAAMGATIVLVIIAIQALRGAFRVAAQDRSILAWPAAVTGVVFYALLFGGVVSESQARAARRASEGVQREERARRQVQTIARCASAYAVHHPDRGFPGSLKDLSAAGSGCLDAAVASGEADGFRYHYFAGVPVETGHVRIYTACAEPVRYGETGWSTTVVDESGTIPTGFATGPDINPGITCRGAWSDYTQAIKHCATRYAATHPDRGYPATLREIGPAGDGCLKDAYQDARFGEHSLASSQGTRYTYVAGLRDDAGRIAAYEIRSHTPGSDGAAHRLVDHVGDRRLVLAPRLALPQDRLESVVFGSGKAPLDASIQERQCEDGDAESCFVVAQRLRASTRDGQPPPERQRALYDRSCAGGFGEACRALARLLMKHRPADSAGGQDAWRRGCIAADGESCLELARLLSKPLSNPRALTPETRPLLERACANRAGAACLWLARDAGDGAASEQVDRYLTHGCDAGDPGACIALGERLAPLDRDRARRLLITGCSASDDKERCVRYW
jgi:hypothetical protein